jgi:hypothetical protein
VSFRLARRLFSPISRSFAFFCRVAQTGPHVSWPGRFGVNSLPHIVQVFGSTISSTCLPHRVQTRVFILDARGERWIRKKSHGQKRGVS